MDNLSRSLLSLLGLALTVGLGLLGLAVTLATGSATGVSWLALLQRSAFAGLTASLTLRFACFARDSAGHIKIWFVILVQEKKIQVKRNDQTKKIKDQIRDMRFKSDRIYAPHLFLSMALVTSSRLFRFQVEMSQTQLQGDNSIDEENERNTVVTNKKRSIYYTPELAFQILEPYLLREDFKHIWDPAAGPQSNGVFPVKSFFESKGKRVTTTDIADGEQYDFFNYKNRNQWKVIVTTPPYALRYQFLRRAVDIDKPFALFVAANVLENKAVRELFKLKKMSVIYPPDKIKFSVPSEPKSADMGYSVWILGGFSSVREAMLFH